MPASSPVGIISHCPRPLFGRRDRPCSLHHRRAADIMTSDRLELLLWGVGRGRLVPRLGQPVGDRGHLFNDERARAGPRHRNHAQPEQPERHQDPGGCVDVAPPPAVPLIIEWPPIAQPLTTLLIFLRL